MRGKWCGNMTRVIWFASYQKDNKALIFIRGRKKDKSVNDQGQLGLQNIRRGGGFIKFYQDLWL